MDLTILCRASSFKKKKKKSRIQGYSSGLICTETLHVEKKENSRCGKEKIMMSKLQNKAKRIQRWSDAGLRLVSVGGGVSDCEAGICRWSFVGLVPAPPIDCGADVGCADKAGQWHSFLCIRLSGAYVVCVSLPAKSTDLSGNGGSRPTA